MKRSFPVVAAAIVISLSFTQVPAMADTEPVSNATTTEYSEAVKNRWVSGQGSFQSTQTSSLANEGYLLKMNEYAVAQQNAETKNAEASDAALAALEAYQATQRNAYNSLGIPPIIEAMATDPDNIEDAIWRSGVISQSRERQATDANYAVKLAEEAEVAQQAADDSKQDAQDYLDESKQAETLAIQQSVDSDASLLDARNSLNVYISETNRNSLREVEAASRGREDATSESSADASENQVDALASLPTSTEATPGNLVLAQQVVVDTAKSMWQTVTVPTEHETTLVNEVSTIEGYQRANDALNLVGSSYQEYTCDVFAGVFSAGDDLSTALQTTSLRESVWQAQPGDLVFFKNAAGNLYQVGVYLVNGLVVVSNASTGNVVVEEIDLDKVLGVGVPGAVATEWSSKVLNTPVETEAKCGGVNASVSTITSTWVKPFETYQLTVEGSSLVFTGVQGDSVRSGTRGVANVVNGGMEVFTESGLVISYSDVTPVVENGQPIASGQALGVSESGVVTVKITSSLGTVLDGEEFFFAIQRAPETPNQDNAVGQNGLVPFTDVPLAATMGVYPTSKSVTHLTSPWGYRGSILPGVDPYHRGMDFAGPAGTPIYAALDGKVLDAYSDGASGNQIIIQHNVEGRTFFSVYKHMSTSPTEYVNKGDLILAGQLIGGIGSTGEFSTGDHLHFEVWADVPNRDRHINPTFWLASFGVS